MGGGFKGESDAWVGTRAYSAARELEEQRGSAEAESRTEPLRGLLQGSRGIVEGRAR